MPRLLEKMRKFIVLGSLFIMLMACAQMETRQVYPWPGKMVWPELPDQPRIKYLGYFSNPKEFGIGKGFFELVIDFFTGAADQRLIRPMAMVAPSPEEIYVADPGAYGVHYFNSRNNDYHLIQLAGKRPLPSPVGLTIGPDKEILVTDSELGGVFRMKPDSDVAKPFYLQYSLKQPTGIAYDEKANRLYIVDTQTHTLNIYDGHGRHIKQVGSRGSGKLQFNFPTMMALESSEQLLITDSLNFRIQRLDRNGGYLSQFGKIGAATGKMTRPKGIATDKLGHIYIIDSLIHALQIFDKKGRLLLHLGGQGKNPGEFWLPSGIFVSDNNIIYIADSHNQRIQVFQYIGG